jgi:hypothetical protein
MKKIFTLSIILLSFNIISIARDSGTTETHDKNKIYTSAGGEFIFSFVNTNGDIEDPTMRFSAWFHMQFHWHYDFTNNIGAFWGLGSRNIGYSTKPKTNDIYVKNFTVYDESLNNGKGGFRLSNNYTSEQRITVIKRREYTIGIPLGFKIGKFDDNIFAFFGGEIEFPFHYKNKVWVDGSKVFKESEWFSKQTNSYFLSVFAGIQMPWGMNFKFKWYLNDFTNRDYTTTEIYTDNNEKTQSADLTPYSAIKSQVFYFSFGMNMFSSKKAVKQIQSLDKQKKDSYDL